MELDTRCRADGKHLVFYMLTPVYQSAPVRELKAFPVPLEHVQVIPGNDQIRGCFS